MNRRNRVSTGVDEFNGARSDKTVAPPLSWTSAPSRDTSSLPVVTRRMDKHIRRYGSWPEFWHPVMCAVTGGHWFKGGRRCRLCNAPHIEVKDQ